MDKDLTVAECAAEKQLIEMEIKGMLQRFSDKYGVRCYSMMIHDAPIVFGARTPKIEKIALTVHV